MKNNLDNEDLPFLINHYQNLSIEVKTVINAVVKENIDDVVQNVYKLPYDLLTNIMGSDRVGESNKKALLLSHLFILNEPQAKACLKLLGMAKVLSLFSGKWPKLKITDENEKILKIFKSKGWISGFDVDKHDTGYFRARGRRAREQETELPTELL